LGKFELPMYPERNAPAPFRGSPQPMRNVAPGEAPNPEPLSHTPIPRGEQKPLLAREVQQFFPPARGETPPEQILFGTAKQQLEPLPGGAPSTTPDFPADQRVDPSAPGPSTTPPQPDDSRIPLRSFPLLENRLKSLLSFSPLLKKALQIPEGVGEKPATAISWQKWVQQLLESSDISPKNRESLLLFQAFLKQASLSETLSPLSLEQERPVSVEKENALQQWTSLGLEEKGAHKLFENLVQFVQKSMEEPAVSPFLFRESLPGFLGQVAKELHPLLGNPEAQEALPQNVSRLLVSLSRVATRLFLLLQDLRLRQSFSEAPTPSAQQSQSAASADAAKAEPASARPEPAPSPPAEGTGKTPPASISPAPSNSLEPQTQATPATPKTGQPPVGDVESKRSIPPQTEAKPLPAQAEERRAGTSAKPSGVSFSPQGEANEKLPPMLSRVMNHFSSAYSPHFYSGLLELEANPFWIDVHRDASESGEGPYQKKELFKIWVETPTMNFGQVQVEVVAREHRLDLQLFVQPEYSHAFSGTAPVLFQRLRDEGFSLQRFLIRNRKPNDELLQEKAKVLLPVKRGFEARG